MASSVKNAASSAAPTSAFHAAQNLRTTSIGLSIWLLLWSILAALGRAPIKSSPTGDTISAPPVAAAARMNVRREMRGAGTSVPFSKSFFMSSAPECRLLPSDPLPDVSRTPQQLDAVPFMRGEEAHRREIHERRLRQVEHEAWTVPLHRGLQLDQVILVALPTEPERRRLYVPGDFEHENHRRKRQANAAPRLSAYEIASWFCGSCQRVGYCQPVGAPYI